MLHGFKHERDGWLISVSVYFDGGLDIVGGVYKELIRLALRVRPSK